MRLKERLGGIFAAVATAALALAVAPATALAAPTTFDGNSLTVNDVRYGDTVTIYQIVETTIDDMTNEAENGFVADFGVAFEGEDSWSEAETSPVNAPVPATEAMANTIATYVSANEATWSSTPGVGATKYTQAVDSDATSVEFTNIEAGQYLVVVTNQSDASRVYQNTIVSVLLSVVEGEYTTNTTASVSPKYTELFDPDDPTTSIVNKQVKLSTAADSDYADAIDGADSTDSVTFRVQVTIPRYVANYGTRTFTLSDDMPDGLVRSAENFTVVAGQDTLGADDYSIVSGAADSDDFTLTLSENALRTYGGQVLTVTYNASFSAEDVPSYKAAEVNTATLEFSTDSIHTNEGYVKSGSDSASVVVYGLTFNKVNEDGGMLDGAVFEIKDGDSVVATATSTDGVVTIDGALAAGKTYTLHETKAPDGYLTVDDATFQIQPNRVDDVLTGALVALKDAGYTGTLSIDVDNAIVDPASNIFNTLPQTGGPGTIALTVVGVGLIAGAAVWAVRSRKEN